MSSNDTVTHSYYVMQACWCSCTLVLVLLYCNQSYRWHARLKLPSTSQYALSTCTKLFLLEATVVLPLWIVKSIDPYGINGLLNEAYTKLVGDLVPAMGLTLTSCMIDSLLRSVATTSSAADRLQDHLRTVQLVLYIPAVCLVVLAVIVTPVAFASTSEVTQGVFMLFLAAVCTSQWLMLNYSGWKLRTTLTAHTQLKTGRDHAAIDAALNKLWKLQVLWTTLYIIGSVLCIIAAYPRLDTSRPWDGGYYFDRQTVTVDYFEWMLVLGFGFLYFYCWLPPFDSSRVSLSVVPTSPDNEGGRRPSKLSGRRLTNERRLTLRRTWTAIDVHQLADGVPMSRTALRPLTFTPTDIQQLSVVVPIHHASRAESSSELEQPVVNLLDISAGSSRMPVLKRASM